MPKKKQITLKEIAKKCGVSAATVSFVLNNKNRKGISATTWNKIEKVFLKYGYKKNKKKKSLKRIIFLLESMSYLATARFLRGISNEVLQNNEFIFLFNAITGDIANLNKVIDKYHPDGIILATGRTKELDFDISKIKSNMILLNCWSKNYTGITILASEYSSSKNLIIDLINRKKNKIAIILPQEDWWQNYEDRLSGWRDAHTETQTKVNLKLICKAISNKEYISQSEIGYLAFYKLIKNNIKFDSIFATNDLIAMGCYQAAKELNIDIPKDVSIVGFDNSETAVNLKPGLTSVQLPIPEMTAKAIQHVFDNKNYDENFKVSVNCDVIERNSVKK